MSPAQNPKELSHRAGTVLGESVVWGRGGHAGARMLGAAEPPPSPSLAPLWVKQGGKRGGGWEDYLFFIDFYKK